MSDLKLRRILANEGDLLHSLLRVPEIAEGALIGHTKTGGLDLVPWLANPGNIALVCEEEGEDGKTRTLQGAILFDRLDQSVYEVHTLAMPEVRGKAYLKAVKEALRIMFLMGDAYELWTRVPDGNHGALGLVRLIQGRYSFRGRECSHYRLTWNDWLWGKGGECLVERGRWFHERLQAQFVELGREHELHEDNLDHDRMVGAASELILYTLVEKAIILYNRWALMTGYAQISIVVQVPLVLNIGDALLQVDFKNQDFLLLDIKPEDLTRAA